MLRLDVEEIRPSLLRATIFVPASRVEAVYRYITTMQQTSAEPPGFQKGSVPLSYIEKNFKDSILDQVKVFLFNYFVISFLYTQLRERKLLVCGEPRLASITISPTDGAHFIFDLSIFPSLPIQDWKYLPFKAPKRKKYKDLDRQVDSFVKEEKTNCKSTNDTTIDVGDWVNFTIALTDKNGTPLLNGEQENMWLHIGNEEADRDLRDIFVGKKVGASFCTAAQPLQEYFDNQAESNYTFCITITDMLDDSYFCLDSFKQLFKLKTKKEACQKLIEVFSYRNDISQRRSMAEESLKLLLSKHRFIVPKHMILRQQEQVLRAVQDNPDYHVYRVQKDFKEHVRKLAEKQAREALLIDQMAYHENISVSDQDVKNYLNLAKRPRTKEFLYFTPPLTKVRGKEAPVPTQELKQYCLREKTLNYIIYHLTRG